MNNKPTTPKAVYQGLLPVPHQYIGVHKDVLPVNVFAKIKAITELQLKTTWAVLKAKNVEFLHYDHYADKVNEAYNATQFDLLRNRIYPHNNTFVNLESFQKLNEPAQSVAQILSNYNVKSVQVQLIAQSIAQEYLNVITSKLPNSCQRGVKTGYSLSHTVRGLTTVSIAVLQGRDLTFINMSYQEKQYKLFGLILKSFASLAWYLSKITLAYWGLCLYQALYSISLLLWTTILGTVWLGLCVVAWVEKCYSNYERKYLEIDDKPTLHVLSPQQKDYQEQYTKVTKSIDALNKARSTDHAK